MSQAQAALRQLTMLIRLGYPLSEGLRAMGVDDSPCLTRLADNLEQGDSLEVALGRQPRLFSPSFVGMIEAAESSPWPHRVLESACLWLERSDLLESQLATAVVYPLSALCVLLVYAGLMVAWVVPRVGLPLLVTVTGRDGFSALAPLCPLAALPFWLLAFGLGLRALMGRPVAFPWNWLPGIGRLRHLAAQSLWARGLGSLLAAGAPLPDALAKAQRVLPEMAGLEEACRQGRTLAQAIESCPGLAPELVYAARGEDLAARFLYVADRLAEEVELGCQWEARTVGPKALALVGFLCLLGIVGFWWPFYELTSAIPQ